MKFRKLNWAIPFKGVTSLSGGEEKRYVEDKRNERMQKTKRDTPSAPLVALK